jgi:HSP20 family protein
MVLERWRPGRELISWRPFRELERDLEEMGRRFEEIFGIPFFPVAWKRAPIRRAWSPPMEVFEKEDKYVVRAELPGMKREEIEVSIVEDTLTIKGEKKAESEVKEEGYYLCERCYGSFERSISLPTAVETGKAEASYENGVLEISLPKVPEVKPRKIEVSVK